MLYNPDS